MFFKNKFIIYSCFFLILSSPVLAKMGTESGGGGDASEERVNEIRIDILNWIEKGGAKDLVLPRNVSYKEYTSNMSSILQAQKVIIGFTDEKVILGDTEKTCKSYVLDDTLEMHILCNISRFESTKDSDQYRLIHHEYAGLARVERNEGAASDYNISAQITDFLSYETVFRLAVKKVKRIKCSIYAKDDIKKLLDSHLLAKRFREQNYKFTSESEAQFYVVNFTHHSIIDNTSPLFNGNPDDGPIHEVHSSLEIRNNMTGENYNFISLITKKDNKNIRGNDALLELALSIPKCK